MLKNRKGVTLTELLIVVITVITLAVISFKMYAHQVEKSIAVDGTQLLRKIVDAEISYYTENKEWCLSFESLPLKIDNGEYLSSDKSEIRNNNFVFSLSSKVESGIDYLSVNAIRHYDDTTVSAGAKRHYCINFVMPNNFDPTNKKYGMKAVTATGYTSKDKAVVNYLNRRFSK